MAFAKHYAEAEFLFEQRNAVLRWKQKADFNKFGGKGIKIKERNIPLIEGLYENINWHNVKTQEILKVIKSEHNKSSFILTPKIRAVEVNNYDGTIKIIADYSNKIEWYGSNKIIITKYNVAGKFIKKFSVEDLTTNRATK